MRLLVTLSLLLLLAAAPTAYGAPPKPRPQTGSGLLIIRPSPPHPGKSPTIILYREPGIGRIAVKAPSDLPLLSQVVGTNSGEYPVAVTEKRGAWVRIAYDGAGREGWIERERRWQYLSWEAFLPGRMVRLLPGLNKTHGSVRREPSPRAAEVEPFSREKAARAGTVQGDWLQVSAGTPTEGWLRWRDENGRFLVSIPNGSGR